MSNFTESHIPHVNDAFFAGLCATLHVITDMDYATLWVDIVQACGPDRLIQYAAFTAPDEWKTAGFKKYTLRLLGRRKPTMRKTG